MPIEVWETAQLQTAARSELGNMDYQLNPSSQKVQEYLRSVGVEVRVTEMPATTRTAKEAAQTIGCSVAQIAKSIVFRTAQSGRPVLVIASGANRVNERRMAELIGEQIEKATPEFVRETTGFVIGGVPPVGHSNPVETWIDRDLLQFDIIWAAAGTPFTVFSIKPNQLQTITAGNIESVI
jgi:prolyl-tRNA editing enzyme YbaK/EbsC (Cys-tRNA(Pro) deacylase)